MESRIIRNGALKVVRFICLRMNDFVTDGWGGAFAILCHRRSQRIQWVNLGCYANTSSK